jgi:hypothetical protein
MTPKSPDNSMRRAPDFNLLDALRGVAAEKNAPEQVPVTPEEAARRVEAAAEKLAHDSEGQAQFTASVKPLADPEANKEILALGDEMQKTLDAIEADRKAEGSGGNKA